MHSSLLPRLWSSCRARTCLAVGGALLIWQAPVTSTAAVTAGGIAIVGYTDESNSGIDTFSVVALEQINAGTVVYFTDNGWSTADNAFRGSNNTNDGDGPETLIKLTFTSSVAAGTVMRSGFDDTGFEWDAASPIPGATTGNFDFLGLASSSIGAGEQIYAFEAAASLPMHNPTNHLFVLDMSNTGYDGFEDASDGGTGNVPPGLSILANTAVSLPDNVDDSNDFHYGSFALNMLDGDVAALQLAGGTKNQWLSLIADSTNWLKLNFDGINDVDAENQLGSLFNITPVPEPSRLLLIGFGGLGMLMLRRRN